MSFVILNFLILYFDHYFLFCFCICINSSLDLKCLSWHLKFVALYFIRGEPIRPYGKAASHRLMKMLHLKHSGEKKKHTIRSVTSISLPIACHYVLTGLTFKSIQRKIYVEVPERLLKVHSSPLDSPPLHFCLGAGLRSSSWLLVPLMWPLWM